MPNRLYLWVEPNIRLAHFPPRWQKVQLIYFLDGAETAIVRLSALLEEQKGNYREAVMVYVNNPKQLRFAGKLLGSLPDGLKEELGARLLEVAESHKQLYVAIEFAEAIGDLPKARELAEKVLRKKEPLTVAHKVQLAQRLGLLGHASLLKRVKEEVASIERQLPALEIGYFLTCEGDVPQQIIEDAYLALRPAGEELVRPLADAAVRMYLTSGRFDKAHDIAVLSGHPEAPWLGKLMRYTATVKKSAPEHI